MTDFYPSRITSEAQMLPRLDPVVHGDWSDNAPLTRRQADDQMNRVPWSLNNHMAKYERRITAGGRLIGPHRDGFH